jgi:hypothetical protein
MAKVRELHLPAKDMAFAWVDHLGTESLTRPGAFGGSGVI